MIKQKIKNLIASARTDEAMQMLLSLTKDKDHSLHDELIILSARLNADKTSYNAGILEYDKLRKSEDHIAQSLLANLNEIDSNDYLEGIQLEELIQKIKDESNGDKKSKILFVAFNPINTTKYELEKEYLSIRKIFNNYRANFELIEIFDTTLEDLFEVVQKEKPDFIHIAGPSTDEYLFLHNDDNSINYVPYKFLAAAFLMFKNYTNCVFMNTWTSPIFLKRISKYLIYSIGSNGRISDADSILFSSGFYTGISLGKSIEDSFEVGIKLLKDSNIDNETILLFKTGYCVNKNDEFPETF